MLSFKTILAAHDLDAALGLKLRPAVDPTGTLIQREALILYLAYLDQLIVAAIARQALSPSLAGAPRRYTSPIWRAHSEGDRIMARLFDEAAIVSGLVGAQLTDGDGISIAQARAALDKAREALGIGQLERGVFEAHAAAAAYAAFAETPSDYLLVFDMGGGTTDFAAFARDKTGAMNEIVAARQSSGLAGDALDEIVISLLMARLRARSRDAEAEAWRGLKLNARTLKEELFAEGRTRFWVEGRKLELRRAELFADRRFKEFARALGDVCAASARALAAHAAPQTKAALLLAGGGAHLGFIADLAVRAAQGAPGLVFTHVRAGEAWRLPQHLDAHETESLPQLSVALGGALAAFSPQRASESIGV
jgi:molecular chaperone DnaK (HSP70)